MQFRVGLVVFATMIVGGLMAGFNGLDLGWLGGKYQIAIEVPQAPGVDTKTPVRKNGIRIGRVRSIEDNGAGVLITVDIEGNRPLYADSAPHIRTSVLGDATIDFQGHQPTPGEQPVSPGAVFRGQVDPNPFDSLGQLGDLKNEFAAASRSLAQAGDEVSRLAKRVNVAFGESGPEGEGRMKRLLDTTEIAMRQFAHTMQSINEVIGDDPLAPPPLPGMQPPVTPPPSAVPHGTARPMTTPPPAIPSGSIPSGPVAPGTTPESVPPGTVPPAAIPPTGDQLRQRLRQGLNELPDAIHEFRLTMRDSRTVLAAAQQNLENLEAFTEPLGQKGGEFADTILRTVDGLDHLVKDLGDVARALNNREGTVGRLLHDPVVHENLVRLMFNVNTVLCDIQQLTFQLKPVVNDARIFMDKIAEEPGRIVTGGLRPSSVK